MNWGDDPIWLMLFTGWFNHQLNQQQFGLWGAFSGHQIFLALAPYYHPPTHTHTYYHPFTTLGGCSIIFSYSNQSQSFWGISRSNFTSMSRVVLLLVGLIHPSRSCWCLFRDVLKETHVDRKTSTLKCQRNPGWGNQYKTGTYNLSPLKPNINTPK